MKRAVRLSGPFRAGGFLLLAFEREGGAMRGVAGSRSMRRVSVRGAVRATISVVGVLPEVRQGHKVSPVSPN